MAAQSKVSDVLEQTVTAVQFHEGGTFRPTLVVGLGGSGVNTARRLKRLLHERYQVRGLIGFLFVDTDQGPYGADPELAPVDGSEKATIFVHNPEQLLEEYEKNPKLHPYFEYILNSNLDVTMLRNADGAAGIRPAGRFAFHASFDVLYTDYLQPAIHRIMQVRELTSAMMQGVPQKVEVEHFKPRIYLICSVCGGTGSAIFMDTAMALRYIMEQNNLDGEIVGVFYLPSVFRNESGISASLMEVIEANAYATLMELEYLCNPHNLQEQKWTFRFPIIGEYTLREPLVDEVFLVEGTNQQGQFLSDKLHAFEMVARSLLIDIGSPIGAYARSAKRNSLAVIETIPCAETGLPRLMNSLAVTSLAVPVEELLRYCAIRAAREMFGEPPNASAEWQVTAVVDEFLSTNQLEERGSSNQIIERLLKGPDGKRYDYNQPSVSDILNEAEGAGKRNIRSQAQYCKEWCDREISRLKGEWLAEKQKHIAQTAEQVLEEAKKAIGNRAADILNERGHDGCMAFLGELAGVLEKVCGELTEEIREHEKRMQEATEAIQRAAEQIGQIAGGPWWQVGGRDKLTSLAEQVRQQLNTYADRSLRREASQQALRILNGDVGKEQKPLIAQIKDWRDLVQHWKTHDQNTDNILRERDAVKTSSPHTNGYELEWLAILRQDFDAFYRTLNIDFGKVREVYARLKEKYQHAPAFGSLMSTHIDPQEEADLRIAAAAEVLREQVRAKANVVEVVLGGVEQGSGRAQYLRRKLKMLFDVCQPFWSTSDPPGEPRYETSVAVSIPPATNGKTPEELRATVEDLCREYGVKAESVQDGYPFAITLLKRCYGARAYYLRSANQMGHFYERRAANEQVRHRLHVDKRFFDTLPKLHPVHQTDEEVELWAWGVAFGYIAQRGGKYYLSVHRGRRGEFMPKYSSEWPLLITEHLPSDWQKRVLKHPDGEDLLHGGRQQAMEKFSSNEQQKQLLREVRAQVEKQLTLTRELDLLEEYHTRLTGVVNQEENEQVRKQLRKELDAIHQYMLCLEARLEDSHAS